MFCTNLSQSLMKLKVFYEILCILRYLDVYHLNQEKETFLKLFSVLLSIARYTVQLFQKPVDWYLKIAVENDKRKITFQRYQESELTQRRIPRCFRTKAICSNKKKCILNIGPSANRFRQVQWSTAKFLFPPLPLRPSYNGIQPL